MLPWESYLAKKYSASSGLKKKLPEFVLEIKCSKSASFFFQRRDIKLGFFFANYLNAENLPAKFVFYLKLNLCYAWLLLALA